MSCKPATVRKLGNIAAAMLCPGLSLGRLPSQRHLRAHRPEFEPHSKARQEATFVQPACLIHHQGPLPGCLSPQRLKLSHLHRPQLPHQCCTVVACWKLGCMTGKPPHLSHSR